MSIPKGNSHFTRSKAFTKTQNRISNSKTHTRIHADDSCQSRVSTFDDTEQVERDALFRGHLKHLKDRNNFRWVITLPRTAPRFYSTYCFVFNSLILLFEVAIRFTANGFRERNFFSSCR